MDELEKYRDITIIWFCLRKSSVSGIIEKSWECLPRRLICWEMFSSFFPLDFLCQWQANEEVLIVEISQLFMQVGSFDVDDLLLNTIGGMLGFIAFAVCNVIRRNYAKKTK